MIARKTDLDHCQGLWQSADDERKFWMLDWRNLANYILPRRYMPLETERTVRHHNSMRYINDSTGTFAARVLASGMMNGITSPARPFFRVGDEEILDEDLTTEEDLWMQHVTSVMLSVMARSNYYNAKAAQFLDFGTFGTTPMIIYGDEKDVIRCYVSPCGEYALAQDDANRINIFSRKVWRTARQIGQLGEAFNANWDSAPSDLITSLQQGGEELAKKYELVHIIEPHDDDRFPSIPKFFKYRDIYYFPSCSQKKDAFIARGFYEKPFSPMRWEVMGNDTYGTSPGWDALPDIQQLQSATHAKAKGIARQMEPPMLIDSSLEHRPISIFPRGKTYVNGLGRITEGMRPAYTPNFNLQDISQDIQATQARIQITCHNDLFRGTSDLQTVRSASEIDVRESEKLIQLGPVVHRIENEGLDVEIARIYGMCNRRGLFRKPPDSMNNRKIIARYISVLADIQASAGITVIERYLAFVAQSSSVFPEARSVPNVPALIHEYGARLRLPAGGQKTLDEAIESASQEAEAAGVQQAAELGPGLAQGAQNLSGTDVGGAAAALNEIL